MKYYTGESNVKFKWEQVSNAIFRRYPNPWSKHVLSEDVVARHYEGPILKTIRIITKTNKLPKWSEKLVSSKSGCVVEESVINAKEKTAVTYTKNISMKSLLTVDERCEYRVSTDTKNWTLLKREAWVSSGLLGLSRAIESLGIERYRKNVKKSLKGLEYVLNKMYVPEKIPCAINRIPLPQTF